MSIRADRVRNIVVIEFPNPGHKISREPKRLRETLLGWDGLTKDLRIREDPAVRIESREHRIPTRTTKRIGAVGSLELHPALGEGIDIRSFCPRIAVAPKVIVQIVRDQEKHVRFVSSPHEGAKKEQAEREQG